MIVYLVKHMNLDTDAEQEVFAVDCKVRAKKYFERVTKQYDKEDSPS